MKKMMTLLLAFAAGGTMLRAQYFEATHGTTQNEYIESGINSSLGGTPFFPGHLMTGYNDIMGTHSVSVIRTDLTGSTTSGPPYFNNFIQYAINFSPIDTRGRRILNYTLTGDEILVWGDYCVQPGGVSDRFFLLSLDAAGNVINYTQDYQLPGPPPFEVQATSMCGSRMFGNVIYVCGWVQQVAGGIKQPIAMCLNPANGAVNWSQLYSVATLPANGDWIVNDIEESVTDIGGFSVAMVGYVVSKIGSKSSPVIPHACFNTVDALTGMPTSGVQAYGISNAQSSFEAINVAYGYTGGLPGFVVAGWQWSWTGMNNDMIAMRFDGAGMGIDFSTQLEYSAFPAPNEAYDVIERYSNVNAAFEYYVGGEIFGDAAVIKLDANGNPVANGEWVYGSTGNEKAVQLDFYDQAFDNSLSIFGQTNSPSLTAGLEDAYHLKSYFNGYLSSGCNVAMANPLSSNAGPYLMQYNVTPQPGPNAVLQLMPWAMGNHADLIPCFGTDPNGSNARQQQLPIANWLVDPMVYPNPLSGDNAVLTLQLGSFEGTVHLTLHNSLGQMVMEKEEQWMEGQSTLQLDLGKQEAGMYLLGISRNGHLTTHHVVVE